MGKTANGYLKTGIEDYIGRLKNYVSIEIKVITDIKNTRSLTEKQQKNKEGELILQNIKANSAYLLDEGGKQYSSTAFAAFLEKKMIDSVKQIDFVIGGAYGFSENVYKKAQGKISLSKMTFSHQMVRLIFTEQLYRAFTIIKGEAYHHQ